jgi:drug/metabolite transporter (DMT)-like permease
MSTRYWIILIAVGFTFGASFAFNETLHRDFGALTISGFRVGIGAMGCWIWLIVSGKNIRIPLRALVGLFVLGAFQFAIPFAVFPLAQSQISSSVAGTVGALTPVLVVILSHVSKDGARMTMPKATGVLFGFAGVSILVSGGSDNGVSDWRFIPLAMMSPLCYAIALNFVSRFKGFDLVVATTWAMTGGAILIVPFALTMEGVNAEATSKNIASLAIFGFGLTTLPFLVLYSILPRVGATSVSLVTFVAPVSSLLIGAWILQEPTGPVQLTGVSFILGGLIVIDGRLARSVGLFPSRARA